LGRNELKAKPDKDDMSSLTWTGVALLDKSMNGTYVNGLKVGKDKQHSLDHGDVISLLQQDFQVYQYMDESSHEVHIEGKVAQQVQ
jgi:pSer/pThr/pTyr-binding forkhead associated (FHA) protein